MFWEELKDSCLVVLRPKDCAQEKNKKEEGGKEGEWDWREEEGEKVDTGSGNHCGYHSNKLVAQRPPEA